MSEKNSRVRVFGAGLPRTGTDTLKTALNQLGFGPTYHMFELFAGPVDKAKAWHSTLKEVARAEAANEQPRVDWYRLLEGYHSAVDDPWASCFLYASRAFPDSKIVLTKRDPDKWLSSCHRTIFQVKSFAYRALTYFVPMCYWQARMCTEGIFPLWEARGGSEVGTHMMAQRIAAVQDSIPADRLLIFDVAEGWEPLCRFLEVDIPNTPFPHANNEAALNAFIGAKVKQGMLRWLCVVATIASAAVAYKRIKI